MAHRCSRALRVFARAAALAPALAVLLAVAAGCGGSDPVAPDGASAAPPSIAAALDDRDDRYSGVRAAFAAAGLDALLAGPNTLLAPDDEAFYNVGPESATSLLAPPNRPILERVLRQHVVPGRLDPASLTDGQALVSLGGDTLRVRIADGVTYVGEAALKADAPIDAADGGRVLRVSTVLREHLTLAERLALSPILSESVRLFQQSGIAASLGDRNARLTLFASINHGYTVALGSTASLYDAANRDLRDQTARQHIITGRAVPYAALLAEGAALPQGGDGLQIQRRRELPYVDGSRVLYTDVRARNGVLHVLDQPLLEHLNLRERLRLMPEMSLLLQLYQVSEHLAWLEEPGPQTLFAFSNSNFNGLGSRIAGTLLAGLRPPMLERLLAYHLATGFYPTSGFASGVQLPTRSGFSLGVQGADRVEGVLLDTSRDLITRNGVIHVVDGVFTPRYDIPDLLFTLGATDFLDLVERAGYEDDLRAPGPFTVVAPDSVGPVLNASLACREAVVRSHIAPGLYTIGGSEPVQLPALGPPGHSLFYEQVGTSVVYYATNSEGRASILATRAGPERRAGNGYVYVTEGILFPTSTPPCP